MEDNFLVLNSTLFNKTKMDDQLISTTSFVFNILSTPGGSDAINPFPIATNIMYLLPLFVCALLRWTFLGLIHLSVLITSTLYHFCQNASLCAFGWTVSNWRSLDHIFAWYALVLTILYVFNVEKFPHKLSRANKPSSKKHSKKLHEEHTIISEISVIDTFSLYNIIFELLNVLLLAEIVYFSTSMIDSVLLSQLVIVGTLFIGVFICRLILYYTKDQILFKFVKMRKHKRKETTILVFNDKMEDFTNNTLLITDTKTRREDENIIQLCPSLNWAFFLLAIGSITVAVILFIVIPEDTDGVVHGLWHFFGAIGGALLLISVYFR